ncbi:response regulator transcription factor [Bdellovibrio sp. NC01]|uniref:response regulator transcription factor n=1 Tax=Bdellovibrio sp. NC01 TaxID=2220073 RepID=UPI001157344C|nr:response regulator [Bdellovibrio sp. NC01]QDK39092.1 transcriptional regulator [Bdellovibrio sp. NC01]
MKIAVKKLLLVEDDKRLREVLQEELSERGFEVQAFAALPDLATIQTADGALLDLRIGNESGLDIIDNLKKRFPGIRIVLMSGFGSVASAVKAMQLGAENFLTKPVTPDMIVKAFAVDEASVDVNKESEISLARMEREYIDYVLQTSDGNITQAAKKLGLHRQSLQRKLRKNVPK